jgi:ATP-binding cassette subfamily C (CFTR/MRP) protein 10
LEDSDVPELEGRDRTEWLEGHFLTNWEQQKEKARDRTRQQNEAARARGQPPPPPAQPSLFRALWPLLGWRYAFQGVLKLVSDCLMFSGPVLLGYLVSFVESYHPPDSAPSSAPPKQPETAWHGYAYATALVLGVLLNAVFSSQYNFRIRRIGLSLRACVVTGVYRHALRQSARGRGQFSSGTLTNVMSTDTERVMDVAVSVHELWSLPIQIGLALFLLYAQVGLALLAGLVVVLLLMPLNAWITRRIARVSAAMMRAKDRRLELINELVRGVRVIKLHALENRFEKAILREREQEIKQLKYRKYFDALCVYFCQLHTHNVNSLARNRHCVLSIHRLLSFCSGAAAFEVSTHTTFLFFLKRSFFL